MLLDDVGARDSSFEATVEGEEWSLCQFGTNLTWSMQSLVLCRPENGEGNDVDKMSCNLSAEFTDVRHRVMAR